MEQYRETRVQQYLSRVLKRLHDSLQLDVRYFLKGSCWLFLPILASYLLSLLRSVAFAHLTEQSTYGQFRFVTDIIGMAGIMTLPGINTALVETVSRGNLGSLADAARARARWGVFGSLAMAGVSLYYLYRGQHELVVALLIAGAFLPLTSALQVVQAYYNGRKRFDMVSLINIGAVVLSTVTLLLILWLQKGLAWLVIANSGSQFVLYLVYYLSAARRVRGAPRDPEMVAYGRSLTWAQAIGSVTFYLDSVILGFSAGFVDVAVYKIASTLPESLKGLMKILMPLAMPKIAEQPDKRVYTRRTRRHLLYLLIFNLVVVLAAIVAIPIVVSLLYGERYAASVGYAQLLMLSLAGGWPSSFFAAALQARRQTQAIYRSNLVYGVLQLSMLLIFVPLWGIRGIVFSRIVSRWGIALYQWRAVTRI